MRKLLHEVQEIDRYLLNEMEDTEKLVFQVKMLLSAELEEKVHYQQQAHKMIRLFAREEQREKLRAVYNTLMNDHDFSNQITAIFK